MKLNLESLRDRHKQAKESNAISPKNFINIQYIECIIYCHEKRVDSWMCEFYAGRESSMTNFLKRSFVSDKVSRLKEQRTETISAGLSLIQQRFIYVTIFFIALNTYTFSQ